MKNKFTFEDFINDKLNEESELFQFEEPDWKEAQSKIDHLSSVDDLKRKRRFFLLIFIGICCLSLLGYFMWSTQVRDKKLDNFHYPIASVNKSSKMKISKGNLTKDSIQSFPNSELLSEQPSHNSKVNLFFVQPQSIKFSKNLNRVNLGSALSDLENIAVNHKKDKEYSESKSSLPVKVDSDSINFHKKFSLASHQDSIFLNSLDVYLSVDCDFPCLNLKPAIEPQFKIIIPEENNEKNSWSLNASLHLGTGSWFSKKINDLISTQTNLFFNYHLSSKRKVSFGLGYSFLQGEVQVGGPIQLQYDFIERRTRYDWNLQNIHFLNIPIQYSFFIFPQHEISIGLNNAFRLKTKGRLTIYESTTLETESERSVENNIDYRQVLPFWNIQSNFSYGYQFRKNATIGIGYKYGFTDLISNDFSRDNRKERLTVAELFFHYKIR